MNDLNDLNNNKPKKKIYKNFRTLSEEYSIFNIIIYLDH